jgi:hypothetical protein
MGSTAAVARLATLACVVAIAAGNAFLLKPESRNVQSFYSASAGKTSAPEKLNAGACCGGRPAAAPAPAWPS